MLRVCNCLQSNSKTIEINPHAQFCCSFKMTNTDTCFKFIPGTTSHSVQSTQCISLVTKICICSTNLSAQSDCSSHDHSVQHYSYFAHVRPLGQAQMVQQLLSQNEQL